jgi:hypothetical protein
MPSALAKAGKWASRLRCANSRPNWTASAAEARPSVCNSCSSCTAARIDERVRQVREESIAIARDGFAAKRDGFGGARGCVLEESQRDLTIGEDGERNSKIAEPAFAIGGQFAPERDRLLRGGQRIVEQTHFVAGIG